MSEQTSFAGPIIQCQDVHKWFGSFAALRGISMEVHKGEVIVIFGPSGSGKSTFIRTLNRLEEHQKGKIVIDGIELTKNVHNIEMSQIIQSADGNIKIRLVRGEHFKDSDAYDVVSKMQDILGKDTTVTVEYVITIERTKGGKFEWIISEKKNSNL